MKDIVWIGWNYGFDMRIMNQTLTNNGLPAWNFGQKRNFLDRRSGVYNFDLMMPVSNLINRGIKMKLTAAVSSLRDFPQSKIDQMYAQFAEQCSLGEKAGYHDAVYDTFVTWLLASQYGNRFKI